MTRRSFLKRGMALVAGASWSAPQLAAPTARRIGLLSPEALPHLTEPFEEGMRERGWTLGRDYVLEARITGGDQERAVAMAQDLVWTGVALIVTISTGHAIAARQASKAVPIVMLAAGYPVEMGLAASLRRPGGNVTGVTIYAGGEIWGKYVQLLGELRPGLRDVGIFWDYSPPTWPASVLEVSLNEFLRAARTMHVRPHAWIVRTSAELEAATADAERKALGALFVTSGGGVHLRPESSERIRQFASQQRLPVATDLAGRAFQQAGCVLAYSPDLTAASRRGAFYVDRILHGAQPRDLPIELPARFELVISLKRAREIGLDVPPGLMQRADRLIS